MSVFSAFQVLLVNNNSHIYSMIDNEVEGKRRIGEVKEKDRGGEREG